MADGYAGTKPAEVRCRNEACLALLQLAGPQIQMSAAMSSAGTVSTFFPRASLAQTLQKRLVGAMENRPPDSVTVNGREVNLQNLSSLQCLGDTVAVPSRVFSA